MDERELERILTDIGHERIKPDPALIRATRQRLHGSRLLPAAVFAGLGSCWVLWGVLLTALLSPGIPELVKVYAVAGSLGLAAIAAMLIVANRESLVGFLNRMEQITA